MRAYLKTSRAKRALMQTWLSKTFNVLDIIMYLLQGPQWLGPKKKKFKIKAFRRAENVILRLVFANKVFHKRATLLIV